MHSFSVIICVALFYPSVQEIDFKNFPHEPETKYFGFAYPSKEKQNDTLNILNDNSEIRNNVSQYENDMIEEQRLESTSNTLASDIIKTEVLNSTSTSSSPVPPTKNTVSTQEEITVTEIFNNESNSPNSVPHSSVSPSSSTGQTKPSIKTTSSGSITKEEITVSSTEDEEQEGVVLNEPSSTENTNTTASKEETIYQKAWALINDTYAMSIFIPVAAGIVFASTILITIATCRCLKRQCRRRRLRKKMLPDSVKNLRPSDRARLLAESSDEEF